MVLLCMSDINHQRNLKRYMMEKQEPTSALVKLKCNETALHLTSGDLGLKALSATLNQSLNFSKLQLLE